MLLLDTEREADAPAIPEPEWITAEEAARFLDLHEVNVMHMVYRGELGCIRFRGIYHVFTHAVERIRDLRDAARRTEYKPLQEGERIG